MELDLDTIKIKTKIKPLAGNSSYAGKKNNSGPKSILILTNYKCLKLSKNLLPVCTVCPILIFL